jgi:hypothetical protein
MRWLILSWVLVFSAPAQVQSQAQVIDLNHFYGPLCLPDTREWPDLAKIQAASGNEERLAILKRISSVKEKDMKAFEVLFSGWFQADSDQALKAAMTIPDDEIRAISLLQGVSARSRDVAGLIELLNAFDGAESYPLYVSTFMARLALQDWKMAIRIFPYPKLDKHHANCVAAMVWALMDYKQGMTCDELLDFAEALPFETNQRLAYFTMSMHGFACSPGGHCMITMEEYKRLRKVSRHGGRAPDEELISALFYEIRVQGVVRFSETLDPATIHFNVQRQLLEKCLDDLSVWIGPEDAVKKLSLTPLAKLEYYQKTVTEWQNERAIQTEQKFPVIPAQ